jgi:hypothetical protein
MEAHQQRIIRNKMKFILSIFLSFAVFSSESFTPSICGTWPKTTCLRSSVNDGSLAEGNPTRSDLIKQLQKSFYMNEETANVPSKGNAVMKSVPLYRAEYTELPGYQNVLHIHDPSDTIFFQKIIHSKGYPKYFGHINKFSNSEDTVGTLCQISDHRHIEEDGSLILIVQALERFVVKDFVQELPYTIADLSVTPDEELIDFYGEVGAVQEAFRLHPYETRRIFVSDCAYDSERDSIGVSPICNYEGSFGLLRPLEKENLDSDEVLRILQLEQTLWLKLDEMVQVLNHLVSSPSSETQGVPIPTRLLGLLPQHPPVPWPRKFVLEEYATKLKSEHALVGTFTQSPFVRVDDLVGYPVLRRAQRLSFTVWTLTNTIAEIIGTNDSLTQQDILEMDSTEERLEAAMAKIEVIIDISRQLLTSE